MAAIAAVGAGADTCTSTGTLKTQVDAKIVKHTAARGADNPLVIRLQNVSDTFAGSDTITRSEIKATWSGGSNTFWDQVFAELDRLETCRAAEATTTTTTTTTVPPTTTTTAATVPRPMDLFYGPNVTFEHIPHSNPVQVQQRVTFTARSHRLEDRAPNQPGPQAMFCLWIKGHPKDGLIHTARLNPDGTGNSSGDIRCHFTRQANSGEDLLDSRDQPVVHIMTFNRFAFLEAGRTYQVAALECVVMNSIGNSCERYDDTGNAFPVGSFTVPPADPPSTPVINPRISAYQRHGGLQLTVDYRSDGGYADTQDNRYVFCLRIVQGGRLIPIEGPQFTPKTKAHGVDCYPIWGQVDDELGVNLPRLVHPRVQAGLTYLVCADIGSAQIPLVCDRWYDWTTHGFDHPWGGAYAQRLIPGEGWPYHPQPPRVEFAGKQHGN